MIIACDLGSNTLRIVQIDCINQIRIKEYEKSVRTAQNLYETGIISFESKNRIFDALIEANSIFDFKSHKVYCVTTQAMRIAKNAKEILLEIKDKFNLDFKIINGEEEARLTLLGVEHAMGLANIDKSSYCMMDLGGGSTELSFTCKGITQSKSFGFGIVLISEKYKTIENIKKHVSEEVNIIDTFIENKKVDRFIATAGTPTSVCAFLQGMDYNSYDYKKINGKSITIKDFTNALEQLLNMDECTREFWVGTNRSDLVCAGILIVIEIMSKIGFEECIVIDDGLREGLVLDKYDT